MAVTEISSSIVTRGQNLLMHFDEEEGHWDVPSENVSGELCCDVAKRATDNLTGLESEVSRHEKKLKTEYSDNEEQFVWQPFKVEIEGEPEGGKWVPVNELEEKELSGHLEQAKDKLQEHL
jgi:hypothetical protein